MASQHDAVPQQRLGTMPGTRAVRAPAMLPTPPQAHRRERDTIEERAHPSPLSHNPRRAAEEHEVGKGSEGTAAKVHLVTTQ